MTKKVIGKAKTLLLFLIVTIVLVVAGCAGDPMAEIYTENIYPGTTDTYDIGSAAYRYETGYFHEIWLNGAVLVPGVLVEVDPVFTASDAFPITAAEIAIWNALVSSQWVADVNGIHYTGNVGIHTNASATGLLALYSSDGISNDPILEVSDNSGSAESTGIRVNIHGAKTDYTDGIYITNAATTGTPGAEKFGVRIRNTGNWLGAGSVNYSLYIEEPTGGTTNVAAWIDGLVDMNGNEIQDISLLNLTDPTELTINAGAITVTQSYHTIDTEGDAATDFLDTINGGVTGDELVIRPINTDRTVILRDGVDNINLSPRVATKSFSFNSPAGGSGTYYAGGFYRAPATDANLTQASPTISYGTANVAYGAHAFLVAGAAGTVSAGSCSIVVSGTSVTDGGVRTALDSETIVADITAMATDDYYETDKKWLGTIAYTLTPVGAATYSADFNYGYTKYDDIGNQHFHLTDFECVGRAGANDNGFNIRLFHHSDVDWTYSAAAFVPGGEVICSMNTDYVTEINLVNGLPFAYKRDNLDEEIAGAGYEGIIVEITTTANKAVDRMGIHLQYHTVPKLLHLDTDSEVARLIYNGTKWCRG